MRKLRFAILPCALIFAGMAHSQPLDLQVELMNSIGTDISRKGDLISARVISPAHLQGDMVEGKVTESRSGAKVGGTSVFSFSFDTLRHGDTAAPISSQFKSVTNSKGKANVDEEGRVVRRATGNTAKVAGVTGTGALIGRIAGGGRGAAIGAAAGATASILMVQIASDGPSIHFNQGSRFVIEANTRSGPSLASLAPNRPPAANTAPAQTTVAAAQPPPVAPQQQSAPSAVTASAQAPTAAAPAPAAAPATTAQPQLTVLKSAFMPGEKTLFYDDFTDMTPGDAPPHFKVRGAAPELREGGGIRQLTATARGSMFPNLTSLPKNFTFEADFSFDQPRRSIVNLILYSKTKQIFTLAFYVEAKQADLVASMRAPYQELGRKRIAVNWAEPGTLAVWVQNGRLRIFLLANLPTS